MDSSFENQRPLGVTLVAVLTLLSSVVIFLLFGIGFLSALPHSHAGSMIDLLFSNWLTIFFVLSACGFFLSLGMFYLRTKYVRYASIVFWIAFLVSFLWAYTAFPPRGVAANLVVLSPLVYAAVCLIYFMSRTPRQYLS